MVGIYPSRTVKGRCKLPCLVFARPLSGALGLNHDRLGDPYDHSLCSTVGLLLLQVWKHSISLSVVVSRLHHSA